MAIKQTVMNETYFKGAVIEAVIVESTKEVGAVSGSPMEGGRDGRRQASPHLQWTWVAVINSRTTDVAVVIIACNNNVLPIRACRV